MNEIINLCIEHLFIVLSSVLIAIAIALPSAIIIYKKDFYIETILSVVSLLQSLPTLAVFAILVPYIGIGTPLAIITLVIYAVLPIFINTIQGFKSIAPRNYELIKTLNINKREAFLKIELPIALPMIISGIRLTTIYTISIATMATLVGAGGLGDLIYLGLQQLNILITIQGLIPLLLMTVIANIIFSKIEHRVMPADQKFQKGIKIR